MLIPSLTATFLAGLAGSPHCIGMCGGFASACAGKNAGAAWHAGRLTTYALLGAIAGFTGAVIPGPAWVAPAISVVAIVWFSAALAGLAPEPRIRIPGLSRIASRLASSQGWTGRWLFGMATSALPCGLVYAALAIPVASGSALVGAASMVVFGLATVPALLVVTSGVRRFALGDIRARRLLAAGVLLAGLVSIGLRQAMNPADMAGMHEPSSAHPDAPAASSAAIPPHASPVAAPIGDALSHED